MARTAKYFKWTPERVERLRRLAPKLLQREIADLFGCTLWAVRNKMNAEGIKGMSSDQANARYSALRDMLPPMPTGTRQSAIDELKADTDELVRRAEAAKAAHLARMVALEERIAFLKRWEDRLNGAA